jgi:hypothetical protein
MPNAASFESFEKELRRLVAKFERGLTEFTSSGYVEAQLRDDFLNPFFFALGWDLKNDDGLIQSKREVEIESRTEIGGRQKRADYLFRTDGHDRFVCEAKKPAEELHARYAFQTKRYAWNKNLPLGILTDFQEFKIYFVGGKPHADEPDVGLWKTWHFRELPLVAQEIWNLLARDKVASGSIEQLLESLPKTAPGKGKARQQWLIRPDRALDVEFLNFLDEARRELASDLIRHNDREDLLEGNKLNEAVQRILDRILFLRICEDRDIDTGILLASIVETWRRNFDKEDGRRSYQKPFELHEEPPAYHGSSGVRAPKDSLWRAIVRHLRALDRRPPTHVPYFNGNLFKPHLSEELIVSDEWLAGFVADLSDDESPYLFSYIPVEILGTIYERFLGKVVRPQGKGIRLEPRPDLRKEGGVYYTPRYIVEYIVAQTVEKFLHDTKPEATLKFRFLDPACGSGSFLIRVFEAVCEHWQQWLTDHPDDRKKKWCWVDANTNDVHLTMALKRQILTNNVFGVDLDPGAVEVTQLSLYLKMLENENRNTIKRQKELLPDDDDALLPPLENNIKRGNSIIASDFSMIPDDLVRVHAFDWNVGFKEIIKSGGFDAVVGNPPYIPIEMMEDGERGYFPVAYPQLERKFDTGVIFILQALKLIKRTGLVGYISSITWETGENFSSLREQMFTKHGVREVINLPFNTFADAYVDTGIYILCGQPTPEYRIYRYSKKAKINSLKDASPVKVSTSLVTAPAFRLVLNPQAQQILVRALSNTGFKQLGEFTKSTQGLAADRFQRGSSARSSEWYPFGEQAQAYRYDFVVEEKSFAYMRDNPSLKQFYEAEPKILIRRIINRQDRLDACYCDEQMVFKKDINPFVLTIPKLNPKFVLGILNSRLLSYLYVNTSAIATKDDFRQTTLAELRGLPIPFPNLENKTERAGHDKLVSMVDKLLGLMPKLRQARNESERQTLQNAVTAVDQQIDATVEVLYGLTKDESQLVEDSQIEAPKAQQKTKPAKQSDLI